MATIKVSDQELKSILSELESELSAALGTLNKSEDGDDAPPKKEEKSKSDSEGGEKKDGPPAPKAEGSEGGEGGGDAPPAPEGSEGGDVPPPPGADAPPAPGAPADPAAAAPAAPATPAAAGAPVDPAAAAPAAPADPAALQAEYATLPPDQLKMHYLAAKAALFAATQGAPAGAPPAPAAPAPMAPPAPAAPPPAPMAPPAGPAPMAPPPMQPPVLKGEKMPSEQNGKLPNTPTTPDIAKSEGNELKELKLQLEVMTKAIAKIAGVPLQKAVTDLTYVAKSEEKSNEGQLTAEQIKAKLNEVARNPLTKSEDRALMNKYVCGTANVDAIKHLLK